MKTRKLRTKRTRRPLKNCNRKSKRKTSSNQASLSWNASTTTSWCSRLLPSKEDPDSLVLTYGATSASEVSRTSFKGTTPANRLATMTAAKTATLSRLQTNRFKRRPKPRVSSKAKHALKVIDWITWRISKQELEFSSTVLLWTVIFAVLSYRFPKVIILAASLVTTTAVKTATKEPQ